MSWLPKSLLAPEKLPKDAKLPLRYVLPYYGIGKIGWKLYGFKPIDPELRWDPTGPWNAVFPPGAEAWGAPSADDTFTSLRLQGPNPFLLTRAKPNTKRGDKARSIVFDLDFSQLFDGVFAPTVARFRLENEKLVPAWIAIGDQVHQRGDDGWDDAKRTVNALDARYSAFIRHLLNTHLMVGQAYALAAYTLPVWHPLRPFMDFFSYGCLQVNEFAYEALLMPDSYFLRSNFISASDAARIVENAMREFDFDEWIVPKDLKKRGLALIPNHPYVEDATRIWPHIEEIVRRHLDDLHITTASDVADDPDLAAWYATLREVLPGVESVTTLETTDDLRDLLTALLYNNVIHEICGNLSPILGSQDAADKVGINFDHLRSLVDPHRDVGQPRAADVFLMDQASYVSRFNVKGNNLLTVNAPKFIDDPRLVAAVEDLKAALISLDQELDEVNARRDIPFTAMQPRQWEASISF